MNFKILFYSSSLFVLMLYNLLGSNEQMENKSNNIDFFSTNSKFSIHSITTATSIKNDTDHILDNKSDNIQEIPLGIPVEKEYFEKLKEQAKEKIPFN